MLSSLREILNCLLHALSKTLKRQLLDCRQRRVRVITSLKKRSSLASSFEVSGIFRRLLCKSRRRTNFCPLFFPDFLSIVKSSREFLSKA